MRRKVVPFAGGVPELHGRFACLGVEDFEIREWENSHGDFKKVNPAADRHTDRATDGCSKQVTPSKAVCDKRDAELSTAVDAEREAGVDRRRAKALIKDLPSRTSPNAVR